MDGWVIYFIDILVAASVFMSWAWWQRTKYNRMVSTSPKAPFGKIMAEFWPETGMRYKQLLAVEANGQEIKAPRGHQCPRYFFNKNATWITKFPEAPFLNLKFLQVDVPIVSWAENNPEPINPHEHEPIATASMIDSYRDDDFAAFAMAASKEIQELERELAKALSNNINKRYVYLLLVVAAGAAAIAAFIAFQTLDLLSYIQSAWGL